MALASASTPRIRLERSTRPSAIPTSCSKTPSTKTREPGVDVIAADRGFDGQMLFNDPSLPQARAIEPLKPMYWTLS